jgi:hypothetical protein|eukprot:5326314-Prymnesium_polylepis.2
MRRRANAPAPTCSASAAVEQAAERSHNTDGTSTGDKPLGQCRGWRPAGAGGCNDGYATDDIYFLEVCLYNQICENGGLRCTRTTRTTGLAAATSIVHHLPPASISCTGADLFKLEVGEFFVCDFSEERLDELERLLMEEPMDLWG